MFDPDDILKNIFGKAIENEMKDPYEEAVESTAKMVKACMNIGFTLDEAVYITMKFVETILRDHHGYE